MRAEASRQVSASISSLNSSSAGRPPRTTAVNRLSLSCGKRRSSTVAALPSVMGTNARRKILRNRTSANTAATATSMIARTAGEGSKNQSAASVAQNATPNQTRAAAEPSTQMYCRIRRRSASKRECAGGSSVGRSSRSIGAMSNSVACLAITNSPLNENYLWKGWVPLLACPAVNFRESLPSLLDKPAVAPFFNGPLNG